MRHLLAILAITIIGIPLSASSEDFRERVHATVADTNTIEADAIAEIEFGREVAAKILGNNRLLRNEDLTHYIGLVGNRVARNAGRPELVWHFAVLDTSTINAYTAPGGYVFVTKGALEQMDDEAELAAVLSHEVAHVTQRHIVKALNIKGTDNTTAGSLARLVGSANESSRIMFSQAVDGAVQFLFEKGLNHSDEFQADQVGITVLANSGYDPMALVRYLSRIGQARPESTTVLTLTHPSVTQRLDLLSTFVTEEKLADMAGQRSRTRFISNLDIHGLNSNNTGEQP